MKKMKLTKEKLIKKLSELEEKHEGEKESIHIAADDLLLEYINDKEIADAFNAIEKWYA